MTVTRRSVFEWAVGIMAGTVLARLPLSGAQIADTPPTGPATLLYSHSYWVGNDQVIETGYWYADNEREVIEKKTITHPKLFFSVLEKEWD